MKPWSEVTRQARREMEEADEIARAAKAAIQRTYKSAEVLAIESHERACTIRFGILIAFLTVMFTGFYLFAHAINDRVLWRFPTKAETERTVPK